MDVTRRIARLEEARVALLRRQEALNQPRRCSDCGAEVGPLREPLPPYVNDFPRCDDCGARHNAAVLLILEESGAGPTAALREWAAAHGISPRAALHELRSAPPADNQMVAASVILDELGIDPADETAVRQFLNELAAT